VTPELADLQNLLQSTMLESSRIALVNYDAAQTNQQNLQQLLEIVILQSKRIDTLVGTVAQLLDALEKHSIDSKGFQDIAKIPL